METLDKGNTHIVRMIQPDDVLDLIAVLEGIATDLSWQPGNQLREYASKAVHFAAYVNGIVAGGLQLVPVTRCSILPCERVWPDIQLPRRSETAHISIMAVRPEYRGATGLLWPICISMWRYCAMNGIVDISLEVTPKLYHTYLRLGWPLEVVGSLRPHWGEECLLCRMGIAEVAGAMLIRAPKSFSYRTIVNQMSQPQEPTASCSEQPHLG